MQRQYLALSLLVLALLLAPAAGSALVPTPAGPLLPADGHPEALYLSSATFFAPGGDYVQLSWELGGVSTGPQGGLLFGQRFSPDGVPRADRFVVDLRESFPVPGAAGPSVEGHEIGMKAGVFLTDDTFAVAWAAVFSGKSESIAIRFFGGNGLPLGETRSQSDEEFLYSVGIERADDERVILTTSYDATVEQISFAFYTLVDRDGSGRLPFRRIGKDVPETYTCNGLFSEGVLGVDALPGGGFLAVFERTGSEGDYPSCQEMPSGIFFREFSSDGTPRGPEMRVADAQRGCCSRVAKLVPGVGMLLLKTGFHPGNLVQGQWFSVDGEALVPAFDVGGGFSDFLREPFIAALPSGEVLVSWNRYGSRGLLGRFARSLEIPCTPGPTTLCLEGGRFRVDVDWADFRDREGSGSAEPLSDETGYFTFFNPENVELVVKVLDGEANNGNFWVFYGALSNVEYRLTVTDTEQSLQKVYRNPARNFASVGDTEAFPASVSSPVQAPGAPSGLSPQDLAELLPTLATDGPSLATAGESGTDLTFQEGRFRASVEWRDFQDRTGAGQGTSLTDDTGYFWFFRPENVELVVKVLDGRANNGNYWVFYGALSNVEYTLAVEDTETGTTKTYFNPLRTFASEGDTRAFPLLD